MESKFHRWWLGSCVAALLLASWVGGFSPAVTAVFIVIYLTGVTLIGPDESAVDLGEPEDVVAAEPVDVVAAAPGTTTAFDSDAPAVGEPTVPAEVADEGKPPKDQKPDENEKPADEPKPETPGDEQSADDTAPAITADADADTDGPAAAEAVIVYESAAAAEQKTVIVEVTTDTDTEAVVTPAGDEDDALPYPDDFDDEAAAEAGEGSPA